MAWLGTWANRIPITIDSSKIDTADLTDFPVVIHLSDSSGIDSDDVTAIFSELDWLTDWKIAVTTSDGTTQCYVEIEKWFDEGPEAWLHVKVPTVAYDEDTLLYLYYDVSQPDNDTYVGDTTDTPAQTVWDSDFVAVWHMAQDPDGDGEDAIEDSTDSEVYLTPNGSMTSADLVAAKVGDGIAFDGSGDCLETYGNQSDLNLGASEEFFIDFVIRFDAMPTNFGESDHIFSLANPTLDRRSYICDLIQSGAKFYLRFHSYNGTATPTAFAQIELEAAELQASTWYHIAIQRTGNFVYFYIDGALHDSGVAFNPASIYNNTDDPFYINSFHGIWSMGEFTIDEFRMTIGADRSAAWAKATYNSLWDSLMTFGDVEEAAVPNVAAEPLEGTFTLSSAGANLLYSVQEVSAEPLEGMFTLSGDVALLTPLYPPSERFEGLFTLTGDVRVIERTLFNGSVVLGNSLKVGDTLSVVTSLNIKVASETELVMGILQGLGGTMGITLRVEERAKCNGILSLKEHIFDADSGITQGDYYFLKSHGL